EGGGEGGGDEGGEGVGGPRRDREAAVRQHREQRDEDEAPDNAEFLRDHCEDEVVVRVRQPAPLEMSLAEPDAEPTAVRDRVPALQRLITRVIDALHVALRRRV